MPLTGLLHHVGISIALELDKPDAVVEGRAPSGQRHNLDEHAWKGGGIVKGEGLVVRVIVEARVQQQGPPAGLAEPGKDLELFKIADMC